MRKLLVLFLLIAIVLLAQPATQRQFIFRYEPVRKDLTLQNLTETERPVLMQHGGYLKSLLEAGKLTMAGQAFDPNGFWGIVIVAAPDQGSAQAILDADPAIQSKLFRAAVVPFRIVFLKATEGVQSR